MIRFVLRTLLSPSESERERLQERAADIRRHVVDVVVAGMDIAESELLDMATAARKARARA